MRLESSNGTRFKAPSTDKPAEAELNIPRVDEARLAKQRKAAEKNGLADIKRPDPIRQKMQLDALTPKDVKPVEESLVVEVDPNLLVEAEQAEKEARMAAQDKAAEKAGIEAVRREGAKERRAKEAELEVVDAQKISEIKKGIEKGSPFDDKDRVAQMKKLFSDLRLARAKKLDLASADRSLMQDLEKAVSAVHDAKFKKSVPAEGFDIKAYNAGAEILGMPKMEVEAKQAAPEDNQPIRITPRRARPMVEGGRAQSAG